MKIHYILFYFMLFFWALSPYTSAAQPDFSKIERVDSIRADYIHTVVFHNSNSEISLPILDVNSGSLTMEFDDSYGEYIDYYYTIKHCDRNWNFTQNIEVADYMDGPDALQIENFGSSVNTIVNYIHYSFTFPNRDIRPRWTGNYLLIIYDAEDNIVLTRRFYVVDFKVPILTETTRPNGIGTFDSNQAFTAKMDVSILNPNYPLQELYIQAFQNRLNERPSEFKQAIRLNGKYAELNPIDQFSFPGYKEYRSFDTRNLLSGGGERINHIDISRTHAVVLLELDEKTNIKPHFSRRESNGAYIIRNDDLPRSNKNVSAEYTDVIYTLKSELPENGDIYVLGEFNDFKKDPAFRMQYLQQERSYSLEVPMKQGYYNYFYALERKDGSLDIAAIEGSSFETENNYHFFVYYRPLTGEYDQIVGYYEEK